MAHDQEVILVTGYKPYELGIFSLDHPGIPVIRYCLSSHMRQLAEEGTKWFVISGQPGIELWAGDICLELKNKEHLDIRLAVLVPFLEQESCFRGWVKDLYDRVLASADFSGAITNRPYQSPAQLRLKNEFLVKKTDGLLILYDEETPGSPKYYLDAAKRRAQEEAYPILTMTRFDLEQASEDLKQQNPDYWSQI
ncbi:DUF1273 family protein [Sporolactobacillus sp. THM7-7]|nr:DUF1273 family protein [Sporolactobacillus sp. THM7-7]